MSKNVKFSILIPTKDRLELLKYAVKSVIMQNYSNWEIVISDNCSEEDIKSWVEELADARIKYIRQEKPLNVTENWNAASDYGCGEYKIMMGDDDALLPGVLKLLNEKIHSYDNPELIVFPAYFYLQPEVDPVCTQGDLSRVLPFNEYESEQILDIETRRKIVSDCCQFKRTFGHNMQHYCYSAAIEKMVKTYGNFYEPPYPDFYASNLMLYIANSVLYIHNDITIIGVTPKSYGYYDRNDRIQEGLEFHKERDFREYAPKFIRDRLCSVDEHYTAAAATYALVEERLKEVNVNIVNYYARIIKNQVKYLSIEQIHELIIKEMEVHINDEESTFLKSYAEECYASQEENRILGTRQMPYTDILQVIQDYEFVKSEMDAGAAGVDIHTWLENMDEEVVKQLGKDKKVYIWGAYTRGRRFRSVLEDRGLIVKGYLDNNSQKTDYDNLPVYKPIDVLAEDAFIVVAQKYIYQGVISKLEKNGYKSRDGYIYVKE